MTLPIDLSARAKRKLSSALASAQKTAPHVKPETLVRRLKPVIDRLEVNPAAARAYLRSALLTGEPAPRTDAVARIVVEHRLQAEREWALAPPARGYSAALGLREVLFAVIDGPHLDSAQVSDRRALTHEQWLRHRVSQLEEAANRDTWQSDTHYSDGYPRPRRNPW